MTTIRQEILENLRQFDTPTICNVIELFVVRPQTAGYMDGRISACYPELPPMVGFAATATFRSSEPPRQGDAYAGAEAQIERFQELSGPAVVVFQDLDDPPVGATFGEVMCSMYRAFGAVGLITSGAGRDMAQIRALDFPLFTSGTICSHGYNHTPDIHVPVRVGGLMIYPDDLLHGDVNGVTNIPLDIAGDVADAAREFVAAEAVVLEILQSGRASAQKIAQARAEQRSMIGRLKARVSRKCGLV